MSQSKVYSQGNIPFSWENQPGVSKKASQECHEDMEQFVLKLPPPPCPAESAKISFHDSHIPLPPCAFQPPSRSSSRRGLKKHEDPFLAAYKECTKTTRTCKLLGDRKNDTGPRLGKNVFNFSCKHSCNVVSDKLVKVSRLPRSISAKDTREGHHKCLHS